MRGIRIAPGLLRHYHPHVLFDSIGAFFVAAAAYATSRDQCPRWVHVFAVRFAVLLMALSITMVWFRLGTGALTGVALAAGLLVTAGARWPSARLIGLALTAALSVTTVAWWARSGGSIEALHGQVRDANAKHVANTYRAIDATPTFAFTLVLCAGVGAVAWWLRGVTTPDATD